MGVALKRNYALVHRACAFLSTIAMRRDAKPMDRRALAQP